MIKIIKNRSRFRFLLILLNSGIITNPYPSSLTPWSLCNNKAMAKGSLLPALQSLSYCSKTRPGSESSALQRMWQISALRYWHKFHIIPLYIFHCMCCCVCMLHQMLLPLKVIWIFKLCTGNFRYIKHISIFVYSM